MCISEMENNPVYRKHSSTPRAIKKIFALKIKEKQKNTLKAMLVIAKELDIVCVIKHYYSKVFDPIMVDTCVHSNSNMDIRI